VAIDRGRAPRLDGCSQRIDSVRARHRDGDGAVLQASMHRRDTVSLGNEEPDQAHEACYEGEGRQADGEKGRSRDARLDHGV
jgi:hypothetical protein